MEDSVGRCLRGGTQEWMRGWRNSGRLGHGGAHVCVNGCTDSWVEECLGRCVRGWTHEWIVHGGAHGQMCVCVWTHGWVSRCVCE